MRTERWKAGLALALVAPALLRGLVERPGPRPGGRLSAIAAHGLGDFSVVHLQCD